MGISARVAVAGAAGLFGLVIAVGGAIAASGATLVADAPGTTLRVQGVGEAPVTPVGTTERLKLLAAAERDGTAIRTVFPAEAIALGGDGATSNAAVANGEQPGPNADTNEASTSPDASNGNSASDSSGGDNGQGSGTGNSGIAGNGNTNNGKGNDGISGNGNTSNGYGNAGNSGNPGNGNAQNGTPGNGNTNNGKGNDGVSGNGNTSNGNPGNNGKGHNK